LSARAFASVSRVLPGRGTANVQIDLAPGGDQDLRGVESPIVEGCGGAGAIGEDFVRKPLADVDVFDGDRTRCGGVLQVPSASSWRRRLCGSSRAALIM